MEIVMQEAGDAGNYSYMHAQSAFAAFQRIDL